MQVDAVAKKYIDTCEVLHPFIYCCVPYANTLADLSLVLTPQPRIFWSYTLFRSFASIPIIIFYSLFFVKIVPQKVMKNGDVIVPPTWKCPVQPHNITCCNAHVNFKPESKFSEVERIKGLLHRLICCPKINV